VLVSPLWRGGSGKSSQRSRGFLVRHFEEIAFTRPTSTEPRVGTVFLAWRPPGTSVVSACAVTLVIWLRLGRGWAKAGRGRVRWSSCYDERCPTGDGAGRKPEDPPNENLTDRRWDKPRRAAGAPVATLAAARERGRADPAGRPTQASRGMVEYGQRKRRLNRGGDLASTGVRDRGARAEDSISPSLIRGGNQRNCERRLRSRCLITSERSPRDGPWLWDDCHSSGLAPTCRSDAWG
jgi:hypothetical protein